MKFGKRDIVAIPKLENGYFSQTFIQDNREIQKANYQMKIDGNQYTSDKSMKLKARIPEIDFIKYGHIFMNNGVVDEKALDRWLDSPEGEHCKTNRGSAKTV